MFREHNRDSIMEWQKFLKSIESLSLDDRSRWRLYTQVTPGALLINSSPHKDHSERQTWFPTLKLIDNWLCKKKILNMKSANEI